MCLRGARELADAPVSPSGVTPKARGVPSCMECDSAQVLLHLCPDGVAPSGMAGERVRNPERVQGFLHYEQRVSDLSQAVRPRRKTRGGIDDVDEPGGLLSQVVEEPLLVG
jgi:hypothetical protein